MNTRGRKPNPTGEVVEIPGSVLQVAQANSLAANQLQALDADAESRTVELATRLGYVGNLSPDVLEYGVAQHMHRTVEACLETGKMLLLLKERVSHGDFQQRLERLGVGSRAAQRLMQSCLKFSNASAPTHLLKAIGNQAKLIELLILDDDEVQELAEEGSTLGITLDDLASMSQKELRSALRKAREDVASKDELVDLKNKKIDSLLAAKKFKPGPDSIARDEAELAVLAELHACAHEVEPLLLRLGNAIGAVGTHPSAAMKTRCQQVVQLVAVRLADMATSWGLEVDLTKAMDLRPAWLKDPVGGVAQAPQAAQTAGTAQSAEAR
jgi:hypothetical protein